MRDAMQADLKAAMKRRDAPLVGALRLVLSAIANAEAVDPATLPAGANASEVDRRVLSTRDVRAIVEAERDDARASAAEVAANGQHEAAADLDRMAEVLDGYLAADPAAP